MELRQLWKIAQRRWWLILLPALTAFAYAAYTTIKAPPGGGYATSIRFTAARPPDSAAQGYEDSAYYPWLASEYVVNALTDWVRTSTFAEEVSARLAADGVEIPAGAIQGSVSADNERSVMVLYLNWGNPDQLQAIAAAASAVLQERSGVYFPQVGQGGLVVVPLDDPAVGAVPPSISARLDPLIRLALGVAAGVALAFLVEYLDPSLRERSEIETLGLAVLAEIPRQRRR